MNILIIAYASEPKAGSEYGVGWMAPVTMARKYPNHDIYVLTRSRCREKIEAVLMEMALPNLHFLFYDIKKWMTYPNEMQSKWGEQINYILWQMLVRPFVKKCHEIYNFDVIHHLTFNQYRTPSPGFWMDVPFVMGPIGGAECVPKVFWRDLDAHSLRKERIRLKGWDMNLFKWLNSRKKNKKVILCSCSENILRLKPYGGNSRFEMFPAIAYEPMDFLSDYGGEHDLRGDGTFEMIYAGKAWDWKGIKIFLSAAQKAFEQNQSARPWEIKLIGIRTVDEQKKVMTWVEEFGLQRNVELIPFMKRPDLLKVLRTCSLSVYPAFRDSGSMSVLEASAMGCPTICFDVGGQDVFPDDVLIKIPVKETYETTRDALAEKLLWAYEHEDEAKNIGMVSKTWVAENLTWDKKVGYFISLYEELIG